MTSIITKKKNKFSSFCNYRIIKLAEKIPRKILRELLLKHRCEERYILERKLFSIAKNHKRVLLVGCEHYNKNYPKMLNGSEVWSIDISEESKEFGAKKHIVGSISDADKFFQKNYFDFIFMGGVLGFGLNNKKEADRALKNCFRIMKPDGFLLIWWNNVSGHNQVDPRSLPSFNLFSPIKFKKYNSGYMTKKGVVLEFLKKNVFAKHRNK